jgi:hypothetical protein
MKVRDGPGRRAKDLPNLAPMESGARWRTACFWLEDHPFPIVAFRTNSNDQIIEEKGVEPCDV